MTQKPDVTKPIPPAKPVNVPPGRLPDVHIPTPVPKN